MKVNQYGQVQVSENEAFEALYSQRLDTLKDVLLEKTSLIDQFNNACDTNADRINRLNHLPNLDIPVEQFDKSLQKTWFMPRDAVHENLMEMLDGMCTTQEQTDRVNQELDLFAQYGMIDLLFYLKYLVDTMRKNNIVWGVGRGSSVASYVLYLIGVHKIDSIKYDLDINEFLR